MSPPQPTDIGSQVAETDERDVIGEFENRGNRAIPEVGREVGERSREHSRSIGGCEHGLAESDVPIAGRCEVEASQRFRSASAQHGAERLIVKERDAHSFARSGSPKPSEDCCQSSAVTALSSCFLSRFTPPGTMITASPKSR